MFYDGNMLATQYTFTKKKVKSNPEQSSFKIKCAVLKKAILKKRFEIQGGGQEMAMMCGVMVKLLTTAILVNLLQLGCFGLDTIFPHRYTITETCSDNG